MDEDFDKMLESIKSLFEDVDFVALSTDGWKSVNRAFLGEFDLISSNLTKKINHNSRQMNLRENVVSKYVTFHLFTTQFGNLEILSATHI